MSQFTKMMTSNAQCRRKSSRLHVLYTAICLLPLFAGSVLAQDILPENLTTATGQLCAGEFNGNPGKALNCTANDINIANVEVTNGSSTCTFGELVTLPIRMTLELNSNAARPDVGIWISENNTDPQLNTVGDTSQCFVATMDPVMANEPFFIDTDADQCADAAAQNTTVVGDMGNVTVTCEAGTVNGNLLLRPLVSWWQTQSPQCSGPDQSDPNHVVPGTSAKCNAEPQEVDVQVVGKLTVVKAANPADGTPFSFSFTPANPPNDASVNPAGPFMLADGQSQELFTAVGTQGSSISVTEQNPPAGWDLTGIQCVSAVDGSAVDFTVNGSTVDVPINANQPNVECTFSNEKSATLTVVKDTTASDGAFDFTSNIPGNASFSITTVSQQGQQVFADLVPGTYTVDEIVPAGWQLNSASCGNGDDPRSGGGGVTLGPGDEVTCTFQNAPFGTVTIVKNTVGGDGSFDFSGDAPFGNFSISTSGGTGSQGFAMQIPPGSFDVTETVPSGWDLTAISCSDNDSTGNVGNATATINVSDGETLSCTFTNTRRGTIVVAKQTIPDGAQDSFTFSGDASGSIADGGTITVGNLVPGNYSSTETVPSGWDLSGIACDDSNSSGDVANAMANFVVDAGETVTCTFTNTQRGSLTIVKQAMGPVDVFDFTSTTLGDFMINTDGTSGSETFSDLEPGSYDASELEPPQGWLLTGASCADGSGSFDLPSGALTGITLNAGENLTCTFVNQRLGSVSIAKQTIGGDGTFEFIGDGPIADFNLTTTGGNAAADFENVLNPADNPFIFAEDPVPAGWALTGVGCAEDATQDSFGDVDAGTATVNVDFSETVNCTFTNTADATLIVEKQTLPDADQTQFEFIGTVAGTIGDGQQLQASGQPGEFSATEIVPAGWALTDIQCSGAVNSEIAIGDTGVIADMAAGETVTCVFTNTKLGSFTVTKQAVPADGTVFNFNGDASGPLQSGESIVLSGLLPGTVTSSEKVPAGWVLENIACSGAEASTVTIGGSGGFEPGDVGVSVDLAPGEDVACTFTNQGIGTIVIEKATNPSGGAGFGFAGDLGPFSLDDGSSATFADLNAGTYLVSENEPDGFTLTGIACSETGTGDSSGNVAGRTATIGLQAGETVTCVFTNTQAGTITVEKQTVPDGSAQSFSFSGDVAGTIADNGTLTVALDPGTYTSTEAAVAGWDLTAITCSDDNSGGDLASRTATFNLEAGESVVCTFTNTQRGTIVVAKQTIPAGAGGVFGFSGDASGSIGGGQQIVVGDLVPGNYTATEAVPPGWQLTGIACDDTDSSGNLATATANFALAAGETVTCVFTNTQGGSITVEKQTDPDGSAQVFNFSGDVAGSIADNGTLTVPVAPGTYTSTEAAVAGWELTGIACSDADSSGNLATATATFVVDPGEAVRCVFTNTLLNSGIAAIKTGVFNDESGDGFAQPGETITYTFTVTNMGEVTLTDVVINDALTGSVNLPVTPGTLAPGEAGIATADYPVTQEDIDNGSVVNQAITSGFGPEEGETSDLSDDNSNFEDDPTVVPLQAPPGELPPMPIPTLGNTALVILALLLLLFGLYRRRAWLP